MLTAFSGKPMDQIAALIYQNAGTPLLDPYLTQLKEEKKVLKYDAAHPGNVIVLAHDIEAQIFKEALEEMVKRYPYEELFPVLLEKCE